MWKCANFVISRLKIVLNIIIDLEEKEVWSVMTDSVFIGGGGEGGEKWGVCGSSHGPPCPGGKYLKGGCGYM